MQVEVTQKDVTVPAHASGGKSIDTDFLGSLVDIVNCDLVRCCRELKSSNQLAILVVKRGHPPIRRVVHEEGHSLSHPLTIFPF